MNNSYLHEEYEQNAQWFSTEDCYTPVTEELFERNHFGLGITRQRAKELGIFEGNEEY